MIGEIFGDKEKDIETKLMEFEQASQIYCTLKNYFRNEGIYERSGDYYYREKVVEKKIHRQKNKRKYPGSLLLDLLCGYGEKPGRIIYSALTVIIISAILYYGVGIEAYVIEGSSFQVVKVSYSSQLTVYANLENLLTCSYFSVVTFTTLGYGDFHPIGASRTIAMVEAFTGVFMLALFVLTMGRKMMRQLLNYPPQIEECDGIAMIDFCPVPLRELSSSFYHIFFPNTHAFSQSMIGFPF